MHDQEKSARRREVDRARLAEGVKSMVRNPLRAAPQAALTAALAAALPVLTAERVFPGVSSPLALSVLHVALPSLIALSYLALSLCAVIAAGRPFEAKKVWRKLWWVFCMSEHGYSASDSPVLLSRKRVKGTEAVVREFFSPGIPLREWERQIDGIEHALNCHLVEPLRYGGRNGNDRRRIVLVSAPGASPKPRGEMTDEL